ncbi:energy transducer TonB [Seleniivibrio woodruffii]|uniref:energy transducer TonB n=1 Tax=Seleniivibrio woodruffii TaxID=1078050 RepID=UPI00240A7D4E|nr:energy transducer TonB [Seleniivibrio woodruffii]
MRKAMTQSLAIHGMMAAIFFYGMSIGGFVPQPEPHVIDLSAYFRQAAPAPEQIEAPVLMSPQQTERVQKAEPVRKQTVQPAPQKKYEQVNSAAVAEVSAPAAAPSEPAPAAVTSAVPAETYAPVAASPVQNTPAPAVSASPRPFDYSGYQSVLNSKLEANKTYPMSARRRGIEGTVKLKLTIAENGTLLESLVVSSSGYDTLDSEALKLVKSVFPVRHNSDKQVSLVVPIVYKLMK